MKKNSNIYTWLVFAIWILAGSVVLGQGREPLKVVYFYSATCEECARVSKALPGIVAPFGEMVEVKKYSIEDANEFEKLLEYEEHYGLDVGAPPAIFVGDEHLLDEKKIVDGLGQVIMQELGKGAKTFEPAEPNELAPEGEEKKSKIVSKFESFTFGAITVGGLVDGINPCAFTTIIFLLSILSSLGKDKHQLAVVGVGFTFSVFVTYFLLGLGFFWAIKIFSVSHGLSRGITIGVAIFTFILAGWSFVDFVRYVRTKSVKSVTLGLPQSVKNKIHKVIRKGLTTRNLLIGSIGVGFLVAILESLCTGQVYLPTIVIITKMPGMRLVGILYLLYYNLMFIIPLVIILVIAYMGVKSMRLGDFLRDHLAGMKLVMAILFAGLGGILLYTL